MALAAVHLDAPLGGFLGARERPTSTHEYSRRTVILFSTGRTLTGRRRPGELPLVSAAREQIQLSSPVLFGKLSERERELIINSMAS